MFYIYVRVSTVEQAGEFKTSAEEQERVCRGVALSKGIDKFDVDVYSDIGQSGAVPFKSRREGRNLWHLLKTGDTLCAAKLDRLFRSAGDALQTIQELHEKGVHVILPEFGLDPITTNGAGKLFFGILSLVADFERDTINERMRLGKSAKKMRGGHIGGEAKYGTRIVGRGVAAHLEPNPREQAVVDIVVEMSQRGEPVYRIQKRLMEEGYKTRKGRKKFERVQIRRIIQYYKKAA